jgi:hypothetical protein
VAFFDTVSIIPFFQRLTLLKQDKTKFFLKKPSFLQIGAKKLEAAKEKKCCH